MTIDDKYIVNSTYQNILEQVVWHGEEVQTRNSMTMRGLNFSATFRTTPLVGVRKTSWKSALREMEWFLSGSNNINDLHPSVRSWWSPWAREDGLIPNNYSVQFRDFAGHNQNVDQVQLLIDNIKKDPYSRRHVITTWNTADMFDPSTPLTNCHSTLIQAFVSKCRGVETLSISMYQRSADLLLGVPHNWIQHWAFLLYLAHRTNKQIGTFTWLGGDCHIYESHIEIAEKIITTKRPLTPNLIYNPTSNDFKADDFTLDGEYKYILDDKPKMIV